MSRTLWMYDEEVKDACNAAAREKELTTVVSSPPPQCSVTSPSSIPLIPMANSSLFNLFMSSWTRVPLMTKLACAFPETHFAFHSDKASARDRGGAPSSDNKMTTDLMCDRTSMLAKMLFKIWSAYLSKVETPSADIARLAKRKRLKLCASFSNTSSSIKDSSKSIAI